MGVPAVRETFGSALDAAEARAAPCSTFGPRGAPRGRSASARHDEEMRAGSAPHRQELKTQLIALQQQGRRDLEQLLLAAEVHQHDAAGDEQRGEREARAERL